VALAGIWYSPPSLRCSVVMDIEYVKFVVDEEGVFVGLCRW